MPFEAKRGYHSGSLRIIMDADYGIKRLREEPEQVGFYIRGTLAAIHSIGYYLLEEYNQKFGLGVPLDEKLSLETFRERAKERNNKEALKFIVAYQKGWQKLLEDPIVGHLIGQSGERHVIIHREHSAMQVQNVALTPDQRYVNVGRPTHHFLDRKHKQFSELEIPDECQYCLEKLQQFRISLITRF